MVRALQSKTESLAKRIREYGVELPTSKTDHTLVCPSWRKSIEANSLLMKIIDATQYCMSQLTRKKIKVNKQVETIFLKDLRERIVYDYNFGHGTVQEAEV